MDAELSRQLRLPLDQSQAQRREDFVVSSTNAHAVEMLDAWPRWPGGCLALVGPQGAGKTHLATNWAARVGAIRILTETHVELTPLAGKPVLYEDADRDPGRRDELLFHLINMADAPGASLLLTCRDMPRDWPTDLPDLRSRLNALPTAEIGEPDDAILESVLRKFFRIRNIKPHEDIFPFLLRRIERSVPKALDMVARLDEAADAEDRPISRALARQILDAGPGEGDLFD